MQNDSLDHCSDAELKQEIIARGIDKQLEDFSDADIEEEFDARYLTRASSIEDVDDCELVDEITRRGLEDDILDYNRKELCENILFALNTNKDTRQMIVELVQNVTGKIVCK